MKNIKVNNLCPWNLYFNRIIGQGGIEVPANVKNFQVISFEEAQAQIQSGNVMFVGTDGMGSHARIQICDEAVRKELFGLEESADAPITQLDIEAVKDLLKTNSKASFEKKLYSLVKTDAEKHCLIALAEEAGLDDCALWKADRIRALAKTASI